MPSALLPSQIRQAYYYPTQYFCWLAGISSAHTVIFLHRIRFIRWNVRFPLHQHRRRFLKCEGGPDDLLFSKAMYLAQWGRNNRGIPRDFYQTAEKPGCCAIMVGSKDSTRAWSSLMTSGLLKCWLCDKGAGAYRRYVMHAIDWYVERITFIFTIPGQCFIWRYLQLQDFLPLVSCCFRLYLDEW